MLCTILGNVYEIPNGYYVYIYLDTRNKGKYQYEDLTFDYEPFYVGKGKGRRAYKHIYEAMKNFNSNKHKNNKIKKIIEETSQLPIIIIYKKELTNDEAIQIEKDLIAKIGRKDLGFGTLINYTNGGEGSEGYKHTTETKNKWSQQRKGNNHPLHKKGGHSDLTKQYMKENWVGKNNNHYGKLQTEKQKNIAKEINSKEYIITFPNGQQIQIKNMREFCKEYNLSASKMCLVAQGKRNHHKNYKCDYKN